MKAKSLFRAIVLVLAFVWGGVLLGIGYVKFFAARPEVVTAASASTSPVAADALRPAIAPAVVPPVPAGVAAGLVDYPAASRPAAPAPATVRDLQREKAYRLTEDDIRYLFSDHVVVMSKLGDASRVTAESTRDGVYRVRLKAGDQLRNWSTRDGQLCFTASGGTYCQALFLHGQYAYLCSFAQGACDFVIDRIEPLKGS